MERLQQLVAAADRTAIGRVKRARMNANSRPSPVFVRHRIVEAVARGASRSDACRRAGVPRGTFYTWLSSDQGFCQAVRNAEEGYPRGPAAPTVEDATPSVVPTGPVVPSWAAILLILLAVCAVFSFLLAETGG